MIPIDLVEDYLVDQEDGLKKLLTWFLNLVMQFEAMDQIEAEPYERADTRKAHRNGYKNRSLNTRVGELNLKKPQFRETPFQTKVFERYSRVEKALINAIVESYLQGVSTRRVHDIVSRLWIEDLSAYGENDRKNPIGPQKKLWILLGAIPIRISHKDWIWQIVMPAPVFAYVK
jgi:putative transposase